MEAFEKTLQYIRTGLLYMPDPEIKGLIKKHKLSGYISTDEHSNIPGSIRHAESSILQRLDEHCRANNITLCTY